MSTKEARISSRIDSDLKNKADAILSELGIKPSQAITMFYTQIVHQKGLPLDLRVPNDETLDAINELKNPERRAKLHVYNNVDDLFTDLNS